MALEGLSVASSITALIQAGSAIANFISLMTQHSETMQKILLEIRELNIFFRQFQRLIEKLDDSDEMSDRREMLYTNGLLVPRAGCLTTYNGLAEILDRMGCAEDQDATMTATSRLRILKRSAGLALRDKEINQIISDLQNRKLSLNLMLSVFTVESTLKARSKANSLRETTKKTLKSHILSITSKVNLEQNGSLQVHDKTDETSSIRTTSSIRSLQSAIHSFERELRASRVYILYAHRNKSVDTFQTSESKWSQPSGLSLSEVSQISVICLPLDLSQLPVLEATLEVMRSTHCKRDLNSYRLGLHLTNKMHRNFRFGLYDPTNTESQRRTTWIMGLAMPLPAALQIEENSIFSLATKSLLGNLRISDMINIAELLASRN